MAGGRGAGEQRSSQPADDRATRRAADAARLIEEALCRRPVPGSRPGEPSRLVGSTGERRLDAAEVAAFGALSEAELIHSWASIDPDVVRGAAEVFTRAHIHSGFSFARYVLDQYPAHDSTWQAATTTKLLGYVGEQRYFDLMTAHGHNVVQAATSNNPVWDFLVDGHEINVKTWSDIGGLRHIAIEHPDVTYAVPDDAVGQVGGNIQAVPGLHHDSLAAILHHSIATAEGASALHAFAAHVPLITIGFTLYREGQRVRAGKQWDRAARDGSIDVVTRSAAAAAGAKVGSALGAHFGAPGVIVGGGGGAVIGGLGGRQAGAKIKASVLDKASSDLTKHLEQLGRSAIPGLKVARETIDSHLTRLREVRDELQRAADRVKRSQRWQDWPSAEDAAVLASADLASKRYSEAVEQAEPVREILTRAQSLDRVGLTQWGVLLTKDRDFAESVGASLVSLARAVTAGNRVQEERQKFRMA